MRTLRFLALAALIPIFLACDGNTVEPDGRDRPGSHDILDAAHALEPAMGFWWLTPMVPNPTLAGTFQADADPLIVVVCQEKSVATASCDGDDVVAQFGVGSGIVVETDHFKVEFDTKAHNLAISTDTEYTTYRIIAYTSPLTAAFGGPFVLGYADVQIGENGAAARNLATPGEMIGLVNDRTLPIRFFINEEAYPYAFAAADVDESEFETFCDINCSFTFIAPDQTTIAELLSDQGGQFTAFEFRPGHVQQLSILVLDEADPALNCANTIGLEKRNCVRARLFPTPAQEFAADGDGEGVRLGLRRCNVPLGPGTPWGILKFDEGTGLTRPDEADVDDFFDDACGQLEQWSFLGLPFGRYARAVADFLVAPAFAGDLEKAGATIRTLSDIFWAKDAELQAVSDLTVQGTVAAGIEEITVQVVNFHSHDDPAPGLEGMEVVFTIAAGTGSLISNGLPVDEVTLLTNSDGLATVEWALGEGTNTLSADAPLALGGPLEFTRTTGEVQAPTGGITLSVQLDNGPYSAGSSIGYTATIHNGVPGLLIHGWVQQGAKRAGGHANTGCTAATDYTCAGSLPTNSLANDQSATVIVQLRDGGELIDWVEIPIHLGQVVIAFGQ